MRQALILLMAVLAGCATAPREPESGPLALDREAADTEVAVDDSERSWRLP